VRELQLRYDLPITMGHDVGTDLTGNHPLSMINYRTGGTPWLILVSPDGYVVYNDFHVDADSLIEYVKQPKNRPVATTILGPLGVSA